MRRVLGWSFKQVLEAPIVVVTFKGELSSRDEQSLNQYFGTKRAFSIIPVSTQNLSKLAEFLNREEGALCKLVVVDLWDSEAHRRDLLKAGEEAEVPLIFIERRAGELVSLWLADLEGEEFRLFANDADLGPGAVGKILIPMVRRS